jgi:hypothetical protein
MFPYSLFKLRAQVIVLAIFWSGLCVGQPSSQETFPTAEKASRALFAAVQSDDEHTIAQIVGGDKDLGSSGDKLADHQERELFLEKYRQMHRIVQEPDGTWVLYIGAENWPFPVPLVSKNATWFFDGDAGTKEVLFRRIGENEEYSLETCVKLSAIEQPPSDAVHGYHFRKVHEKKGSGTDEVIFIAYPAEYRSSGVMTFVVTEDHEVFVKDLGPQTASIATTMGPLRVDRSWHRAQ